MEVNRTYFDIVLYSRLELLYRESLEEHENLVASMERRVAQEVSPLADLELVRSRTAQIEQELASISSQRVTALQNLAELVRDPAYRLGPFPQFTPTPVEWNDIVVEAVEYSPARARLLFESDALRSEVSIARASILPRVSAQYSYNEITGSRVGVGIRRNIGCLPQDYRLINGTLRDNLLLGIDDPGDDALMDAAGRTGLDALIAAHPQGIDLPIGEGGRGLSGGQRVLAGLTRLQLCQPSLLLLDEPTSNLDPQTEARVLAALQAQLRPEDTLVMVTHKMQLLGLVQRVLVMVNGRIVLDGPTKDVVARLTQPGGAAAAAVPAATSPAAAPPAPASDPAAAPAPAV